VRADQEVGQHGVACSSSAAVGGVGVPGKEGGRISSMTAIEGSAERSVSMRGNRGTISRRHHACG